ncbi:MAG: response regulator transcription factor [Bryobacterales bacterium]|nr:response regulator transcription factor [Acidobacteriota bacterium]MCB9385879.1 response regulator transcription factor [Bryobacterales bacterium]
MADEKRILLVEDEPGLRLTLSDRLRSEGYAVETASNGDDGLRVALAGGFDILLLDVMLPGKSGFDICRDLRQHGDSTPILMLTARGQTVDKVLGLKIGADDYLTKPFETLELLARIEALLRRRSAPATGQTFQFDDVRVDFRSTEVRRGDEALQMSAKEFQLLKYFIEHRGETLSREVLLHEVWGYESMPSTRTVDVHVAWLRQKVEEDPKKPKLILTVHGMGYKFVV